MIEKEEMASGGNGEMRRNGEEGVWIFMQNYVICEDGKLEKMKASELLLSIWTLSHIRESRSFFLLIRPYFGNAFEIGLLFFFF